jgi:hypothetical protein
VRRELFQPWHPDHLFAKLDVTFGDETDGVGPKRARA